MAIPKKAAAPVVQRMSLDPANATHGGLIDDVDVEITDAGTTMFNYGGQSDDAPALAVEYTKADGNTETQYYACGKAEDWKPTDDNTGFVTLTGKTGFNDSTNLMKFMASLIEHGFPVEKLQEGDVTCLIGLKGHVNQVAVERQGLKRQGKNAERGYTVLLFTSISALPGTQASKPATSKAAVGGKSNGAAKTAPAAAAAPAQDLDGEIVAALLEHLSQGEPLPKKGIGKVVMAHFSSAELAAMKAKAITRANAADFLGSLGESGIAFDGATLSLAE